MDATNETLREGKLLREALKDLAKHQQAEKIDEEHAKALREIEKKYWHTKEDWEDQAEK